MYIGTFVRQQSKHPISQKTGKFLLSNGKQYFCFLQDPYYTKGVWDNTGQILRTLAGCPYVGRCYLQLLFKRLRKVLLRKVMGRLSKVIV